MSLSDHFCIYLLQALKVYLLFEYGTVVENVINLCVSDCHNYEDPENIVSKYTGQQNNGT